MGQVRPLNAQVERHVLRWRTYRGRATAERFLSVLAVALEPRGWRLVRLSGVYRDVLVRRWRNLPGRTMWDFPGGRTGGGRLLVIGLGSGEPADPAVPS